MEVGTKKPAKQGGDPHAGAIHLKKGQPTWTVKQSYEVGSYLSCHNDPSYFENGNPLPKRYVDTYLENETTAK